jgi:rhodanese-related sulfurtransferase
LQGEGIEIMTFRSPRVRKARQSSRRFGVPGPAGLRALGLALILAWGGSDGPARAGHAGSDVLHADEAWRMAEAGQIVLVDVRSPEEWQQTGVPAGARAVTIHNAHGLVGFLDSLRAELNGDFDRPIALICARGNRSSLAFSALSEAGYSQVLNVREGMLGSADGPGWLSRGLPTDNCGTC